MEIDLLLARSTPSDKGEDVSGKRGTHLSPLIAQPHSIFLSRLLLKRQQGITDDVYTLRFFSPFFASLDSIFLANPI